MKAILEIELPECCGICNLVMATEKEAYCLGNLKKLKGFNLYSYRSPRCPLKIIDEGKMKTHDMNDAVYYKLTPKGKEIWENKNNKFNEKHPALNMHITYIDKEWVRDTLWCCFERFGGHTGAGGDVLIYDITFDDPLKEA